jgi:PAS domain S-box-containing protein
MERLGLDTIIRALEHSGDGVLITDARMAPSGPRIVYVNRTYLQLTGYAEHELIGQTPRILQGPETDRAVLDNLRHNLEHALPFHGETVNYRRDGSPYWVEWDIAPVRDETGAVTHFISIQRDVSARKASERALASTMADLQDRNERLDQFASVVSHDLQDPLSAARGYLELTLMMAGDELGERRHYLETAIEGIDRAVAKVRDLLGHARGERQWARVDLGSVIASVLADLRMRLGETQADVVVADLPVVVGDPVLLGQIFQNLIGNALKYRQPGRVPRIRVFATLMDGDWRFTVEDNGRGIRHEDRQSVFERYNRGSTVHEERGHGIGLAVVKRAVEAHGGCIWLDSEPDAGTCVHFTLPVAPSAP